MTNTEVTPKDVQAHILCERISHVCREIGAAVSEIEGQVIASSTSVHGSHGQVLNLQKIDMVLQSIEEISLFVARCQAEIPDDCIVNIDANLPLVRLEWMRDVLAGSSGHARLTQSASAVGISLF